MADAGPIPINLITGYLGSGKTTLLRHILSSADFARSLVLINEFGEIGLDHLLIGNVAANSVLFENGCICCSIRGDFRKAMLEALGANAGGYGRVFLEMTGLADPAPVIAAITGDPVLRHHYRLGNIIATVDAVHWSDELDKDATVFRQIAVADRILLTKPDLVSEEAVTRSIAQIRQINPAATIAASTMGNVDTGILIGRDIYSPATKSAEAGSWFAPDLKRQSVGANGDSERKRRASFFAERVESHTEGIQSIAISIPDPIDWHAFGLWLTLMAHRHGERILRIKGIVRLIDSDQPVVLHGVQSLLHPAEHLPEWPAGDRTSKIIMIVRGLNRAEIERSLNTFLSLKGGLSGADTEPQGTLRLGA